VRRLIAEVHAAMSTPNQDSPATQTATTAATIASAKA